MKTWIETLEEAKAYHALGAGSFTVGSILDDAKELYAYEEAKEKEKENKKEKKTKEMTFEETGAKIGRLVTEKNKKYGDSFTKSGGILRILYPDGIKPDQYGDLLPITRILDKFFRISTDNDPDGEDPWVDVAGYGILKVAKNGKQK